MMNLNLAIIGGTFDPVHNGHLALGAWLLQHHHIDQIIYLPNRTSLLCKHAQATAQQRFDMLTLAVEQAHQSTISRIELDRSTPSYTLESLQQLQQQSPDHTLCLVIGSDQFNQFNQWHQWQSIITLCQLWVIQRDGQALTQAAWQDTLINKTENISVKLLTDFHDDITSTQVRTAIKKNQSVADWVPKSVAQYISQHQLYL